MTRFAAAARTAAFIAAAGTTSVWIGSTFAWPDGMSLQADSESQVLAAVQESGSLAASVRYGDQGGRASRSYYGWSYPYIFPFDRPQVIARRPVTETGR
jgi:hypothetical protein